MARNFLKVFYILLAAFALGACSDANDRNRLAVYVCDSPADYGGVNFYIAGVEIRAAGSGAWTPLAVSGSYVALMELINGKMQEAARATLPQGTSYDAVRLTFSPENAYVVIAGESIPLAVDPADAAVTVPVPTVTMDGPDTPVLLDIDVAASVVGDASAPGGYRFRPQVSYVNLEECGVVQGGLQVGETAVASRLWIRFTDEATGQVGSTYCSLNPAGAFFKRLLPGNYTLEVVPAADSEIASYTTRIEISRQRVTDLGNIVLESNGR